MHGWGLPTPRSQWLFLRKKLAAKMREDDRNRDRETHIQRERDLFPVSSFILFGFLMCVSLLQLKKIRKVIDILMKMTEIAMDTYFNHGYMFQNISLRSESIYNFVITVLGIKSRASHILPLIYYFQPNGYTFYLATLLW